MAAVENAIGDAVIGQAQSSRVDLCINGPAIDLEKLRSDFRANVVAFGSSDRIRTGSDKSPARFVDH
jgi:hypothetical protein